MKEKPDQQAKLYNQNEQRVSVSVQARGSVDEFRNQHFLKATSQKTSWQVRLRHSKCGIFSLNLWWRAHAYYRWGCRGFFRAGNCLPPSSWTGVFLQECCKATLTSTEAFRKTVAKKTLYKTVVQSSSTRILHEMLHKCSTNHLKSRGLQGLLKVFHMTEFQGVWRGVFLRNKSRRTCGCNDVFQQYQ